MICERCKKPIKERTFVQEGQGFLHFKCAKADVELERFGSDGLGGFDRDKLRELLARCAEAMRLWAGKNECTCSDCLEALRLIEEIERG